MDEREAIKRGAGLWGDPSVPKKGWVLLDVYDIRGEGGEDTLRRCEMCQIALIRYVHVVEHPDVDYKLEVGCICGGKLTSSPRELKDREGELRRRSARRGNFLKREWKLSKNDSWYLTMGDYVAGVQLRVVLDKDGDPINRYKCWIRERSSGKVDHGAKVYRSLDEAKLALFAAVQEYGARDGRNTAGR